MKDLAQLKQFKESVYHNISSTKSAKPAINVPPLFPTLAIVSLLYMISACTGLECVGIGSRPCVFGRYVQADESEDLCEGPSKFAAMFKQKPISSRIIPNRLSIKINGENYLLATPSTTDGGEFIENTISVISPNYGGYIYQYNLDYEVESSPGEILKEKSNIFISEYGPIKWTASRKRTNIDCETCVLPFLIQLDDSDLDFDDDPLFTNIIELENDSDENITFTEYSVEERFGTIPPELELELNEPATVEALSSENIRLNIFRVSDGISVFDIVFKYYKNSDISEICEFRIRVKIDDDLGA